jgi:predicted CoA-binding protein
MSEDNPTPHTLGIDGLLASVKRIAVLGIKTESQSMQPAFYVPAYLQRVGYTVIPVPVYYPEVTEILGQPVVRRLEEVSPRPVSCIRCSPRRASTSPPGP